MAQLSKEQKLYNPTLHAVERARQRYGIAEKHAKNWFNQLMESAYHVTTNPNGSEVYKHDGKDLMIVVGTNNMVVTVFSQHESMETTIATRIKPSITNAIIEKAREVITKEIAKARRQFTTESRKLTLHEAELGLEIAKLTLNKARAKAPHIQAILQAQITDLENGRQAVFAELLTVKERFEQMRRDAEGYL